MHTYLDIYHKSKTNHYIEYHNFSFQDFEYHNSTSQTMLQYSNFKSQQSVFSINLYGTECVLKT